MSDNHDLNDKQSGDCLRAFKPPQGVIVGCSVLSVLLLLGGMAAIIFPLRVAYLANWNLPLNAKIGWSWFAVGLLCLVGLGLEVGAAALIQHVRFLVSHGVGICANGLRYVSGKSVEVIPWEDIVLIQETVVHVRLPILKGPAKSLAPTVSNRIYVLTTRAGKEFKFDSMSLKSIAEFGEMLRDQADCFSLRWESEEEHA